MSFREVPPDTKCANCGHKFEVHAIDISFPEVQRCFHNAVTGVGCAEKYDDRCKNFIYPEGL